MSKLSVKNVQLVLAADESHRRYREQRHRSNRAGFNNNNNDRNVAWEDHSGNASLRPREWNGSSEEEEDEDEEGNGWHAARDESTLLSFGKLDRDSFSLEFRWPLTPMQAFGSALAALDTSI